MSKKYFLKLIFLFCFFWFLLPFPIRADGDAPLPVKAFLKIINVPETKNLTVELLNLDSNFYIKKENLIKFHKYDYTGITQWTGETHEKILSCEGIMEDNPRDLFVAYRNLGTYNFDRNGSELSLIFYLYNCSYNSDKYIARIKKDDQIIDSFPFSLTNACYKGGNTPKEITINFDDLNRQKQLTNENPNKSIDVELDWKEEEKNRLDSLKNYGGDYIPNAFKNANEPYYGLNIETGDNELQEHKIFVKKSNILVTPRQFSNKLLITPIQTRTLTPTIIQKDTLFKTITEEPKPLKNNEKVENIDLTKLPFKSILKTGFLAILFTLGIELLIAFLMKIKNYKIIFWVNLLTQFCLQTVMFVIWYFWYSFYGWQLLAVLEIIIFISEFVLYFKLIKKINPRKLLIYTIIANLLSLASSPIIAWLGLIVN